MDDFKIHHVIKKIFTSIDSDKKNNPNKRNTDVHEYLNNDRRKNIHRSGLVILLVFYYKIFEGSTNGYQFTHGSSLDYDVRQTKRR
ncbi:unnamed protein product [Rotaria socialis]